MGEHGYDDAAVQLARDRAGAGPRSASTYRLRGQPSRRSVLQRLPQCAPREDGLRGRSSTPTGSPCRGGSGAARLLALLATPPVRAAVADWFGFGGVRVESVTPSHQRPVSRRQPRPPDVSLAKAAAMVGFAVSVPEELGEPDGVEVSPDRRMVSMSWTTDQEGAAAPRPVRRGARLLRHQDGSRRLLRRGERHRRALVRRSARGGAPRARRHHGHPLGPARRAHPDLAGGWGDPPAGGRRRTSAGPWT